MFQAATGLLSDSMNWERLLILSWRVLVWVLVSAAVSMSESLASTHGTVNHILTTHSHICKNKSPIPIAASSVVASLGTFTTPR